MDGVKRMANGMEVVHEMCGKVQQIEGERDRIELYVRRTVLD